MIACHVTPEKKQQMECSILGKIGTFVLHQYSSNDDVYLPVVVANWCTFSLGGNKFVKLDWVGLTQIVTVGKPAIIIYPLPGWPNFISSI